MTEYDESKENLYSIALILTKGVGVKIAKRLVEYVGSAVAVLDKLDLLLREGWINKVIADEIADPRYLVEARAIVNDANKYQIKIISYTSEHYPSRLRECVDAPIVLFYRGQANLNVQRVVSIVGTRNLTEYGRRFIRALVGEMVAFDPSILLVSGLAYGADVEAHKSALKEGLPTVAVLAHGLDRVYPNANRGTANKMLYSGGLLTEFTIGTEPERYNFVSRNRIVAGLSDVTIVIESALKGGSLITADLANDYNRECFALPGDVFATYSKGCNNLIRLNKAHVLTCFQDVVDLMGWNNKGVKALVKPSVQRRLFPVEFSEEELAIVHLLEEKGEVNIDVIENLTEIDLAELHTILFSLEMSGYIKASAGSSYSLA